MLNPKIFQDKAPALQDRYWPHVNPWTAPESAFWAFVRLEPAEQRQYLVALRRHPEAHGRFLHTALGSIYSYRLDYRDSPCYQRIDDHIEGRLELAKIALEDELMAEGLAITPIPRGLNQDDAAAYLRELARCNAGTVHELYDYLATGASKTALETMLYLEVIRNEVVDDEVALLTVGLQGLMKAVAASNLWDECGHGKPMHFHTYWLRRLLEHEQGWEFLATYSQTAPWYARIASNTFNMLLMRPAYTYHKYGYFLITESWVAPHFTCLLEGLERVGLDHKEITVYFKAHLKIDPRHGTELVDGFAHQRPRLTQVEIDAVLRGAHLAIAAGTAQYDRLLPHLVQLSFTETP